MSHTTLLAEALPADVSVSLMAHLKVSKLGTASLVIVISLVVQPAVTPRTMIIDNIQFLHVLRLMMGVVLL